MVSVLIWLVVTRRTISNWNEYDQSRVNTWDSIYTQLQTISPGSYCIMESFVNNNENAIYANQGMMVWGGGDLNTNITQADMGFNSNWDFSGGLYTNLGFSQPGVVDYQESHDETTTGDERVMFKLEYYGNGSGAYSTKTLATALQRAAMGTSFWALMPGPKMMWMFGELGYDYSPDECANGTSVTCGNTDPKPLPWANYYTNANRQALYSVYSKLFNLRQAYPATFETGSVNYSTSGSVKWMSVWSSNLQVMVYGNFDVVQETGTISFPSTGTWYNLFTGTTVNESTTSSQSVTLNPGEYYVYVNIPAAVTVPVRFIDFTAQYQNGGTVLLNFTTTNELTNDHYDIERSIDGINFTQIGAVAAAKNAAGSTAYSFNDITATTTGKVYYRIKQIDVTGQYTYSKVLSVTINSQEGWHTFFAGNSIKVVMQANANKVNIVLHDALGRTLIEQTASNVTVGQVIEIPTNAYAKGLYLISVTSESGSRTDKVIVK